MQAVMNEARKPNRRTTIQKIQSKKQRSINQARLNKKRVVDLKQKYSKKTLQLARKRIARGSRCS